MIPLSSLSTTFHAGQVAKSGSRGCASIGEVPTQHWLSDFLGGIRLSLGDANAAADRQLTPRTNISDAQHPRPNVNIISRAWALTVVRFVALAILERPCEGIQMICKDLGSSGSFTWRLKALI